MRSRGRTDRAAGLLDILSTGLDGDDLADLTRLRAVTATDPDAAPGIPDHPIVCAGDVWLLGDHRIVCGDSTDPATVRAVLGDDRPHLMVTDPPYGVEYDPSWRNKRIGLSGAAVGQVLNDDRTDWAAAWRLFPGDVAYCWHAPTFQPIIQASFEEAQFTVRSQIVWNKSRFVIGRGDYHWKHELCAYCVRKGATGHWQGSRDQTTVWDIAHTVSESGHGTQKPIECMRRPILNNSAPGDAVYEPFSGSGTTIIAAEMERRRCLAVELNPLYVYVAISRWQNFVSRAAVLQATGEPFAEVFRRRKDEQPATREAGSVVPVTSIITTAPKPDPALIGVPVSFATPARPAPPSTSKVVEAIPIAQPPASALRGVAAAPTPIRIGTPAPPRFDAPVVAPRLYAADPRAPDPFIAAHSDTLRVAGAGRLNFDEATWDHGSRSAVVGVDVETFENFFLVCFKRFSDGKRLAFERSARADFDRDALIRIMTGNQLVSFNGTSYDIPIITLAAMGADNARLKKASDLVVRGNLKPWEVNKALGVDAPSRIDHIDLMEPNPSIRQGLKVLHGRLHGRFMVDLPYDPDAWLTPEMMNVVTLYCFNDLDATQGVFEALREPLALREALGREHGMDLRSKSDAQIGEAIIKKRAGRVGQPASEPVFGYTPPPFIRFEGDELNAILRSLSSTEFRVNGAGKVETPPVLKDLSITIGAMQYNMGIGGIHSTEAHRALHSDDERVLIDVDVASQYPNIILKLGLYPAAFGPVFLDVYRETVAGRLLAKRKQQEIEKEITDLEQQLKVLENG